MSLSKPAKEFLEIDENPVMPRRSKRIAARSARKTQKRSKLRVILETPQIKDVAYLPQTEDYSNGHVHPQANLPVTCGSNVDNYLKYRVDQRNVKVINPSSDHNYSKPSMDVNEIVPDNRNVFNPIQENSMPVVEVGIDQQANDDVLSPELREWWDPVIVDSLSHADLDILNEHLPEINSNIDYLLATDSDLAWQVKWYLRILNEND